MAAVGNSYEITLIYIALAMGCNIGCSVVTANLFGQHRSGDVKTCVRTSLLFSCGLGLLLTVLGTLLGPFLLQAIRTPEDIMADSLSYLNIYLLGYIFLLLYNVSTGIFSALGDSRTPFYFLAFSSVSNIFVDILFVAGFRMGVNGVAWATFLCQSISGILALTFLLRKTEAMEGDARRFSFTILKRILYVAVPSALQQSFISVGNILIQGVINGFGVAATGGYAAAVKLNNLTITSLTALGNGISNYTAQNLGAKRIDRVRQGGRWGALISLGLALIFLGIFFPCARLLVGLFISDGNTQALGIGADFLRIVSPFYLVICLKLAFDGIIRGGQKMSLFMISTFSDLILRVGLSMVLPAAFGLKGVWYSWPIGWFVGTSLSVMLCLRWLKTMEAQQ